MAAVSLEIVPLEEVRLPRSITERIIDEEVPAEGYLLEMLNSEAKTILRMRIYDPSYLRKELGDPVELSRIVSKELHPEMVNFSMVVPAPTGSQMLRFIKVAPDQKSVPVEKRLHDNLGEFILPTTGCGLAVPTENFLEVSKSVP